jgi:hypothetical protein
MRLQRLSRRKQLSIAEKRNLLASASQHYIY